jgi:hypothetical protein
MKKILSRKVLFIVIIALILTLASLSAFASTPLGESMATDFYLPLIYKTCSGTIPC